MSGSQNKSLRTTTEIHIFSLSNKTKIGSKSDFLKFDDISIIVIG